LTRSGHRMPMEREPLHLSEELRKRREIILRELKRRTLWFIRLRWFVPPSILAGIVAARLIGVEFAAVSLLLVAIFIFAYNVLFDFWSSKLQAGAGFRAEPIKRFTYWQVGLDYVAMFLLIHFTGGAASPLIFFFIFHVIFAAILLPPRSAYGFAGLAAAGMAVIAAAEYLHWLPHHALSFQGKTIDLAERPFHILVNLGFFTASVFITAFSTTSIMPMFRKRIQNLSELSDAVVALNNKLNALYGITKSISSTNRFEQVLDIVCSGLADTLSVEGISIKLLDQDGGELRYAAAYGLPPAFKQSKVVEVAKSPLNRRIIEGEPFVTGNLTQREMFQFGEDLAAAGFKSVLFVALIVENRVIGILGAYSLEADRFGVDEVDFFRLAAGLVAVALENAQAFEAIDKLVKERSWFMMRMAHNLRAPLTAIQSIINLVLKGDYLGGLTEDQRKYLSRVDQRSQSMLTMVNELMTLAEARNEKRRSVGERVPLRQIAGRLQEMFQPEAQGKGISFSVSMADDFPDIPGDPEMIEQMIENLVSNGIKYTNPGGRVDLKFSRPTPDWVQIQISDTGIGIPQDAMPRLFTEFFRAENAKKLQEMGTGLGLAFVKDVVNRQGGRITVQSEEGKGTTFTALLPILAPVQDPRKGDTI